VLIKTLRAWVGLGVVLAGAEAALPTTSVPTVQVALTVSVYDDAGVGLRTMEEAEEVASYIFHQAGIEVQWINCSVQGELTHSESCGKAIFPTNLQVRIVRKARDLKPGVLGISYLSPKGDGCYSDVFVEPAEELSRKQPMDLSALLGHAAAHEIAHLLLGKNAHTGRGLMRARWQRQDLVTASQGSLRFDADEAETMRRHIAEGMKRNEAEVEMEKQMNSGRAD